MLRPHCAHTLHCYMAPTVHCVHSTVALERIAPLWNRVHNNLLRSGLHRGAILSSTILYVARTVCCANCMLPQHVGYSTCTCIYSGARALHGAKTKTISVFPRGRNSIERHCSQLAIEPAWYELHDKWFIIIVG